MLYKKQYYIALLLYKKKKQIKEDYETIKRVFQYAESIFGLDSKATWVNSLILSLS